jgi:glycosyltransferase involved in cell wall biosynthesis
VYLGVDPQFNPESEFLMDMAIAQKYGVDDFYVLYLGGYALHKNITTLLLAYTYVAKGLGEDYPLVLAGNKPTPGPTTPDYDAYIERLALTPYVKWIGYVDEEDKPALYRQASCFVFPSRLEGFGLPPLEAMACGVPVVTTDGGSLPEVVGDAAFTVDPDSARGMAGAIIASVLQDNLADEMRAKGKVQAAAFTWERTIQETLVIYDRVLQELA